jgi:hypothetical protein
VADRVERPIAIFDDIEVTEMVVRRKPGCHYSVLPTMIGPAAKLIDTALNYFKIEHSVRFRYGSTHDQGT